ncbi:ASB8 [Symbiodinium sp. CCMP2592]|nr:ASB8 [Symbiodinium sp. CCMP2592]
MDEGVAVVPRGDSSQADKEEPFAELNDEEHEVSLFTEGLDYLLPLNLARSPQAPTNVPVRPHGPLPTNLPENLVSDRLQHIHPHERDVHLRFDNATHTYFWQNKRVMISVTQMIHKYADKFDPDQTLKNMSEGRHWPRAGYLKPDISPDMEHKINQLRAGPRILAMLQQKKANDEEMNQHLRMALQQANPTEAATLRGLAMSSSDVKRKWETARDEASHEETWMHAQFECLLNGGTVPAMTPEISLLCKFLERLHHATIYRTEWKMYADDIDVAGSIDCVLQRANGSLELVDWKRSSKIASRGEHFGRFMKPPLDHLADSTLSHYHLQLNVYRWILQNHYRQIVTEMYIVGTHPDNGHEPWIQQVDILDDETARLVADAARERTTRRRQPSQPEHVQPERPETQRSRGDMLEL